MFKKRKIFFVSIPIVSFIILCSCNCDCTIPSTKEIKEIVARDQGKSLLEEGKFYIDENKKAPEENWLWSGKSLMNETNEIVGKVIQSLNPQCVRVSEQYGVTVVIIQTSGGFYHEGLILVYDAKDKDFVPQHGRNWMIKKLANRVFLFKE